MDTNAKTGADAGMMAGAAVGRRDRTWPGGHQVVEESLAQKVLHGWLQNRHQTLFPLTVNLRLLQPGQAASLAGWAAVAALAVPGQDQDQEDPPVAPAAVRAWLAGAGADPSTLACFDAALADPPPLHRALHAVAGPLGPHAYVAALVATDPHEAATHPFLAYVAARLALPATVVRSATRRHRR